MSGPEPRPPLPPIGHPEPVASRGGAACLVGGANCFGVGWCSCDAVDPLRMMGHMSDLAAPLPTNLGRPAIRAFEAAGYRSLADLEGASEQELLALHGVGPRVITILREGGVALAP